MKKYLILILILLINLVFLTGCNKTKEKSQGLEIKYDEKTFNNLEDAGKYLQDKKGIPSAE